MAAYKIMFSINNDIYWNRIIADLEAFSRKPQFIDKMAVVAMGTSILSLLNSTRLDDLKQKIADLATKNVALYICIGTMHKYGITQDMLLPQFTVADNGADIKILELRSEGYELITARDD